MVSLSPSLCYPLLKPRCSPTPSHDKVSARAAARSAGVARASTALPRRRSANFQPSLWQDSVIQTLTSDYTGEAYEEKLDELKGRVRRLIVEAAGAAAQLELLDVLRRLGVDYHFEQDMKLALHTLSANAEDVRREVDGDLLHTALLFRLFREHGLEVSQDIFDCLRDKQGDFKGCFRSDIEGILSLYEASFLAYEGEEAVEELRACTTASLSQLLLNTDMEANLRERVEYALEMPLHWRVPRLHARWFIDLCKKEENVSTALLELAKLDFNMVQSKHIRDVRAISRWWEQVGLQDLSFSRDRIMENFLWTVEMLFVPKFSYGRHGLTQINALITSLDDIYDVYGSMDELEIFTQAIERWDVDAMDELPEQMKACFRAVSNTTHQLADQCYEITHFNCLPHLRKSWIDLCKCYLIEARWYYSNHMPNLREYMENAWKTISGPLILTHAYFLLSETVTREALEYLENYGNLIRWSSTILRLSNDLATSMAELERGDVPKSIQCLMHERNVPVALARRYIMDLINDTWMKINKEYSDYKFLPKPFVTAAINLARMAQCIYHHGDGYGVPDKETKSHVKLVLIEPIYW